MKKNLIYGMGKTGKELARFCTKRKIPFSTFDDNRNKPEEFQKNLRNCNRIIVSPGVGLRNENIKKAIKAKIKVISEIEFAAEFISKPLIAITGTNGKTTTALLTYDLLKSSGLKVFLGGNIGTPLIKAAEDDSKYDLILIETSSFQLQFIDSKFHPNVSVLLNISENHLNHHLSMKEYVASKKKVFKNSTITDYAIIDSSAILNTRIKGTVIDPLKSKEIYTTNDKIIIKGMEIIKKEIKLIGPHNIKNILFSLNIFSLFKEVTNKQLEIIQKFSPPIHRLERIGTNREIINDSKSTSPQATEVAIESFKKNIVLIMGGKDKKLDYSSLLAPIRKKVVLLILFGENKFELAKVFDKNKIYLAPNLYEAVRKGLKESNKKGPLIFSPGTSSFDQFNSYSQRGEVFKKYVKELS